VSLSFGNPVGHDELDSEMLLMNDQVRRLRPVCGSKAAAALFIWLTMFILGGVRASEKWQTVAQSLSG
jgi:phosphoribosyl-dephospho-CoA transferase